MKLVDRAAGLLKRFLIFLLSKSPNDIFLTFVLYFKIEAFGEPLSLVVILMSALLERRPGQAGEEPVQ